MLDLNAQKFLILSLISHLLSELLSTGICFSTYEEYHHLAFYTEELFHQIQSQEQIVDLGFGMDISELVSSI